MSPLSCESATQALALKSAGHSTTRLTLDTYSHVLKSMQEKTSAKLEDMLYSKTGT